MGTTPRRCQPVRCRVRGDGRPAGYNEGALWPATVTTIVPLLCIALGANGTLIVRATVVAPALGGHLAEPATFGGRTSCGLAATTNSYSSTDRLAPEVTDRTTRTRLCALRYSAGLGIAAHAFRRASVGCSEFLATFAATERATPPDRRPSASAIRSSAAPAVPSRRSIASRSDPLRWAWLLIVVRAWMIPR